MDSKRTNFILREVLNGVKKVADLEISNGHKISSFDPEAVIFGLKLFNIPYDCYNDAIFPDETIVPEDHYFIEFQRTINDLTNLGYDYTILSHRAFVYASEDGLRRYHAFFEQEPVESRHRFLGPLMVSPDEANAYADVLMRVIAELVEHPRDKKGFLLSYADALIDYHIEYVNYKLFEIGNISGPVSLARFLANPITIIEPDGKAYRQICSLSPILKRPELAHVVDYFDQEHSSYVARQHYADLFSAPFAIA